MKKIAVYIADQQDVRLKALAEALGIKQAELLRQCLEEGLRGIERDLMAHRDAGKKAEETESNT